MHDSPTNPRQRLGVTWVLRQAAIVAVLALTAVHLTGVVCLAAAERQVSRAAKASASEAVLPAASLWAVSDRAMRVLRREGFDSHAATVAVYCSGRRVSGAKPLRSGDEVRVTITLPCRDSLPITIGRLAPWLADEDLVGEATIVVP